MKRANSRTGYRNSSNFAKGLDVGLVVTPYGTPYKVIKAHDTIPGRTSFMVDGNKLGFFVLPMRPAFLLVRTTQ